jgi:tungstate transport system substrate-binding protein
MLQRFRHSALKGMGIFLLSLFLGACAGPDSPQMNDRDMILATTTSTQDSGLLDLLVPIFEQQTGFKVKTIAVGTGAALKMGEQGEADVLLVHAPAAEKPLVEKGLAIHRSLVMHNDYILVGPTADPAQIKGTKKAMDALQKIAAAKATFVSRGDDSGTHKMENSLWKVAGFTPKGGWYQQSGSGMGQTLKIASEKNGYTLTDRATYLAFRKHLHLDLLLEGDPPLMNIYHVMQVNPAKFGKVNGPGGKAFVDFMVSEAAQATIGQFGVDKYGQPLFFPDAGKTEAQLQEQR